ncbi:TPA: DUF3709 domain-containing protein [Vibrio vulnificus]|nr:DUF3709 domain-containing protein [Vibrio vulnificus]HAS6022034.1 DUF3709 domain-containing protein [Vibrio vulnificus]HAS6027217.1 DUF3709 domain-containing protein [Vibrio vulnificus]HAS6037111.1 DUF3709 domain-containing protein [Vibrio vulnificus]HDY7993178.1 DUF3709 domain-containing protein [Vibrio vulnificus]
MHKNQQVVIIDSFGISFWFCRQFNIVFRSLMKRQCVCRCKFQCYCLIELSRPCVMSEFVGEGFHIGLVAK